MWHAAPSPRKWTSYFTHMFFFVCFFCEPPIWSQFFVYNRQRYGHRWATMLQPLRSRALRLNLCDGMLSGQLACALAREPEVDDGALYLSLCTLSEWYEGWCVTHKRDTTTMLTHWGLNLYELHTSLYNTQTTYSVDSDDDTDFEYLFLLPKLENIWKEHALQAEQHARHEKCFD